jgi:hypothetical protein
LACSVRRVEVAIDDGRTPFVGRTFLRLRPQRLHEPHRNDGSNECSAICLHNPAFCPREPTKNLPLSTAGDEWSKKSLAILLARHSGNHPIRRLRNKVFADRKRFCF